MLTTACTTCATEFLVTPEQLKLREGRVRCGKCETVFNALATLKQRPDPDQPTGNVAESFAATPAVLMDSGQIPETPIAMEMNVPDPFPPADLSIPEASILEAPSVAQTNLPEPAAPETTIEWPSIDPAQFPAPHSPAEPSSTESPAPLARDCATPGLQASALQPALDTAVAAPEATVQTGGAAAFDFGPQKTALRSRWWTPLACVLLLGLFAQAAFYFRGAIAFMVPETKPYIVEICAELGCDVPLPRRAELISIETSDLQADPTNPGVIVLLATLRNRAAFPQTFPALELTLTNDRDQPLARRVLQPVDYLADKTEAFDGSSEKQVRLNIEAGSLKASGYRLYLFYP